MQQGRPLQPRTPSHRALPRAAVGLLYFKNEQVTLEKKIRSVVTRGGVGEGNRRAETCSLEINRS